MDSRLINAQLDLPATFLEKGMRHIDLPGQRDFIMPFDNPQVSSEVNIKTQELYPTKLDSCFETDGRWLDQYKTSVILSNEIQDRFLHEVGRKLWKLEEAGIQVFSYIQPVHMDSWKDERDRMNRHHLSFEYNILEEDLVKHAFIDGVWREGAVEEAVEHTKKIVRRNINRIFNDFRRREQKFELAMDNYKDTSGEESCEDHHCNWPTCTSDGCLESNARFKEHIAVVDINDIDKYEDRSESDMHTNKRNIWNISRWIKRVFKIL